MNPRVGLTVSYENWPEDPADAIRLEKYLDAIRAGGVEVEPLFLDKYDSDPAAVVRAFDGFVVAGGADLPTHWYGQEPIPEAGLDLVDERRPNFEKAVLTGALAADKPVLGICYGVQFLNALRGGELIQDIHLQLPGTEEHRGGIIHSVKLDKGSKLREIIGLEEFDVPSFHHQAVSTPAPGAEIVALSPDGVIEALEWPGKPFFLGVQWHPERDPDSQATRRLFEAFAAACR